MSAWDTLIKPDASKDRRIDPANCLLIANTDYSVSVQAADWYQDRRGVGHRIDMSLGATNTSVPNTHPIVEAVRAYRDNHRIECVIASADCPYKLGGFEFSAGLARSYYNPWQINLALGGWGYRLPTAAAWGGGPYTRPGGYTQLENPNTPVYAPDGKGRYVIGQIDPWHLKDNPELNGYSSIAHGCLGFTFSYGSPRLNTLENIRRMVDDCIWAEQQPKNGKKLELGFGTYTADGSKEVQWYAWQIAEAAGLQVGYYRKQANLAGIDPVAWLGQAEDTPEADFFAGVGNAEGDIYLGSAVINGGTYWGSPPSTYHNSLHPRRGAWGFNWCSFGGQFVNNLIYRGGAAGIGPMFEPFVAGLADDASILSVALKGFSLAEIAFYCSASFAFTAWGDPLYRPFPMRGLLDGQSLRVTDITPDRAAADTSASRDVLFNDRRFGVDDVTPNRRAIWQN